MTWHAYASRRAAGRPGAADITYHAVDHYAHCAGAPDAECGATVSIHFGDWQPGHPRNCARCAAAVGADTPQEHAA